MHHVVLFLQSNVDDRVWDLLADAVEELGLADNHAKLGVKVDFVAASGILL